MSTETKFFRYGTPFILGTVLFSTALAIGTGIRDLGDCDLIVRLAANPFPTVTPSQTYQSVPDRIKFVQLLNLGLAQGRSQFGLGRLEMDEISDPAYPSTVQVKLAANGGVFLRYKNIRTNPSYSVSKITEDTFGQFRTQVFAYCQTALKEYSVVPDDSSGFYPRSYDYGVISDLNIASVVEGVLLVLILLFWFVWIITSKWSKVGGVGMFVTLGIALTLWMGISVGYATVIFKDRNLDCIMTDEKPMFRVSQFMAAAGCVAAAGVGVVLVLLGCKGGCTFIV